LKGIIKYINIYYIIIINQGVKGKIIGGMYVKE